MECKIGDVVLIKSSLKAGEKYGGVMFNNGKEKVIKIHDIYNNLYLSTDSLMYSEDMFDKVLNLNNVRCKADNIADKLRIYNANPRIISNFSNFSNTSNYICATANGKICNYMRDYNVIQLDEIPIDIFIFLIRNL